MIDIQQVAVEVEVLVSPALDRCISRLLDKRARGERQFGKDGKGR